MEKMIGPTGPDGCSKINCSHKAMRVDVYACYNPGSKPKFIEYKWCDEHQYFIAKEHYPMILHSSTMV